MGSRRVIALAPTSAKLSWVGNPCETIPRALRGRQLVIALNLSSHHRVLRTEWPPHDALLSTYLDDASTSQTGEIELSPTEGRVLRMLPAGVSDRYV
jgi:hypothetical protein